MMAMNGLLVNASSAVLCLHDHDFGHFIAGEHPSTGEDCHAETATAHDGHGADQTKHTRFVDGESHCIDIIVTASDLGACPRSVLFSTEKLAHAECQHAWYSPAVTLRAMPETRVATRAPPAVAGILEQCVRKTVLRL